jgi:predicted transglutaminase-like cysteine proteinase
MTHGQQVPRTTIQTQSALKATYMSRVGSWSIDSGQTDACQAQPNENTKVSETMARERVPSSSRNKEYSVDDRSNRNQVEGNGSC